MIFKNLVIWFRTFSAVFFFRFCLILHLFCSELATQPSSISLTKWIQLVWYLRYLIRGSIRSFRNFVDVLCLLAQLNWLVLTWPTPNQPPSSKLKHPSSTNWSRFKPILPKYETLNRFPNRDKPGPLNSLKSMLCPA